jgi:hypothetical protein
MKHIKTYALAVAAGIAIFASCKKSNNGNNVSTIQKQVGQVITSDSLCGGIKGTLASGKTYLLTCPVTINAGDTVLMQSGVTINVVNPQAYILVQGSFISSGTKTSPNWITVSSITKQDNQTTADAPSTDPAFTSSKLWLGIQCDSSCALMVMKWTHLEFAGGTFGTTPPIASLGAGNLAWPLYFKNPNGFCIVEDSWFYGSTDDAVRFAGGKIYFVRNTVEKQGYIGGDCFNAKHGTVGIMAYNTFVGTATNGTKASDKGTSTAPTCQIDMFNNTYVNGGYRQQQTGRGGDINYEQGSYGQAYNNLIVDCKFGFRIVGNPIADTANCHYGYNYSYGDADSIVDQFYPVGYISNPVATNIPAPSTFLPVGYVLGQTYTAHSLVGANNPLFVNYPLGTTADININYVSGFDFHLQTSSPALGKGYTGWSPLTLASLPVDATFGVTALVAPGKDIGAYQADGTGNQH